MKYLYALMDDETRFWIAQQVADTKYTANINPLFREGKEITGKRPNTLISDGAPNFNDAFKKEFYTNTIQEPDISNILDYKETTITTKWRGSTAKLETEKR